MEFSLAILSDHADNGSDLVADALGNIAVAVQEGYREGDIRDVNGNLIGNWKMTERD